MNIKQMNYSGVYLITNDLTGEFYGGSSKNIQKRWRQHINNAKNNTGRSIKLYNAMRKYGIENFSITPLIRCTTENLFLFEQRWLDENIGDNCYNISKFADNPTRGRTLSETHKHALRKPKTNTGNMGRSRGFKQSSECKQKIGDALRGTPKSDTHRQNISKSVQGKPKHYFGSRDGELNPNSKLTKEQIIEIKKVQLPKKGVYLIYTTLAKQYNVSWNTIRNILLGYTYEK